MKNNEFTFREIWETLRQTDCSEHIKNIPGPGGRKFSYISWTWAWGILMQTFPGAVVSFDTFKQADGTEVDVMYYPDGTASVQTTVTIGDCSRTIRNAVMDNRYNALKNPNSRDVNDARMRCMVKNLAFFGLGTECYFGEDLPDAVKTKKEDGKPKSSGSQTSNTPSPTTKKKKVDKIELPKDPFPNNYDNFLLNVGSGVEEADTLKELSNFYKEILVRMKPIAEEGSPLHKTILGIFTERKNQLKEEMDNG